MPLPDRLFYLLVDRCAPIYILGHVAPYDLKVQVLQSAAQFSYAALPY